MSKSEVSCRPKLVRHTNFPTKNFGRGSDETRHWVCVSQKAKTCCHHSERRVLRYGLFFSSTANLHTGGTIIQAHYGIDLFHFTCLLKAFMKMKTRTMSESSAQDCWQCLMICNSILQNNLLEKLCSKLLMPLYFSNLKVELEKALAKTNLQK